MIAATSERARELFEGLSVAMRIHRARLKLTQDQAARRAGLNARHWSEIERGKKRPGLDSPLGIAEALDTPLPRPQRDGAREPETRPPGMAGGVTEALLERLIQAFAPVSRWRHARARR